MLVFSVDSWESSDNLGYNCVEAQFCDKDWVIDRYIVGFGQQNLGRSTTQVACADIKELFSLAGLNQPLFSMTSDTTAVMPAIAGALSVSWMPCTIHRGNLTLKHAIENVPDLQKILLQMHDLCNWTRSKKKALALLKQVQADRRAPKALKPLTNRSPRFMVDVDVMRRFLQIQPYLADFLDRYKQMNPREANNVPNELSYEDVGVLSSVLPLLSSFQDLFYRLEGESRPLSAIYYPTIIKFISADLKINPGGEGPVLVQLKTALAEQWLKYFSSENELKIELVAAAWCDPFYHTRWIDDLHKQHPTAGFLALKQKARDFVYQLALTCYREELRRTTQLAQQADDDFEFQPMDVALQTDVDQAWQNHFQSREAAVRNVEARGAEKPVEEINIERQLEREIRYFEAKAIGYNKGPTDTLAQWKRLEPQCQHLARAVRVLLALPITSAACERDFSASKALRSNNRRRMSDETLEMLVRLRRRSGK